jgi:hypothetical protein
MSKRQQQKRERKNLRRRILRELVNTGWLSRRTTVTKLERYLKTARGERRVVISRLLKGQIGKASFDPTAGMKR